MQIISWSDGYVSRLKTPCSVNYPPISGYYIITDKMVIRSKLYTGFGGDTYIVVDLGL